MRCSRPGVPGTAHGPGERRLVAQVRVEALALGAVRAPRSTAGRRRRDAPRLGAGGEEGVGHVDDRRHVLEREPPGLDREVEALAGGGRRDDRHGRVRVAPEHAPGAGRPARSSSACPVEGPERWTSTTTSGSSTITASPRASLLSAMPGPGRGGHAHRAAVARADRRADGRDLVLGLERLDAEVLVARELVEDVRGRA